MGLTGGIKYSRLTTSQRGRHQDIFRSRHTGFIEHHVGAFQPLAAKNEILPAFNINPQRLQPLEMGIQPASANHITTRRG